MSYLLNSRYNNCLDYDEEIYRRILRGFGETAHEWKEYAEGNLGDVPLDALYFRLVELYEQAEKEDGPDFWSKGNSEATENYQVLYDLAAYIIVGMVEKEFPGFFWPWANDRSCAYDFIGSDGRNYPHPMFMHESEWKPWCISIMKDEIRDNERYLSEQGGYLPEEVYIGNEQMKRLVANH
jgi:hypothetical protein